MQKAIEYLKIQSASLKFKGETIASSGDLTAAAEIQKEASECLAAAQILETYLIGRESTATPEEIVNVAKEINGRCSAVIAIRDCDGGFIDMDVRFFPKVTNDSPAHQAVTRVVQIMNETNKPRAANDAN
jgi:hypothetical protein